MARRDFSLEEVQSLNDAFSENYPDEAPDICKIGDIEEGEEGVTVEIIGPYHKKIADATFVEEGDGYELKGYKRI